MSKPSQLRSFISGGLAFGSYQKDAPKETFLALDGQSTAFLKADEAAAGPAKTGGVYFTVIVFLFCMLTIF